MPRGNLETGAEEYFVDMNRDGESQVVPALVAVVGVVAFGVLIYLLLWGADWLINRLLGATGGTSL